MQQIAHIDRAIAALEALKAKASANDCQTLGRQVESYEKAKDFALEAFGITADLSVRLAEVAAERGSHELTAADRAFIRDAQPVKDALFDADMWADEARDDLRPRGVYNAAAE